jgi:RHS repeat-associated protein
MRTDGCLGGFGSPFTFTGELTDANALLYLRARYYSPALGVFTALDPVESVNRYQYVGANPINAVDPSGVITELLGTQDNCQQNFPCPPAGRYVPEVDYSLRRYVDQSWMTEPGSLDLLSDLSTLPGLGFIFSQYSNTRMTVGEIASLLAGRAEAAGNDDAARNFRHFFSGGGDMNDYPVEKMLKELPLWRRDILNSILIPSVAGALQTSPQLEVHDCSVYFYNTVGGCNPNTGNCLIGGGEYNTWRRVGQGSSQRGSDATIFSRGFDLKGSDFEAAYSSNLVGATREEFDWFLAMNAFDYSLGISIVVNNPTGEAEICYRIYIADEYAWYGDVSMLDTIMSVADLSSFGEHFNMRGRSAVRCEKFNVASIKFTDPINLIPMCTDSD